MNWRTRTKLFTGVLFILLLSSGLVVLLDYRHANVHSETAEITADSYTVGVDFSGLVTEQFIAEGDYVNAGDTLFHIKSTSLKERITEQKLTESELLYPLNQDGDIIITAARPGLVSEVSYTKGSFVPANEIIAVLIDQSSLEVVAAYRLARRDFQKLNKETQLNVVLPGGNRTTGNLRAINVLEQVENYALVEITATISDGGEGRISSSNGVPVATSLQLNQTTMYDRLRDFVSERTFVGSIL